MLYFVVQAASNAVTRTKTELNQRRWNVSVRPTPGCDDNYLGRLSDWYPRDELTRLPVTPAARRRSLSPTRKLALEQLEVQDKRGSLNNEAAMAKSGGSGGTGGCDRTGRQVVVYKAQSVLDIERLARRADRRRAEAALHLVSHDPNSSLFRSALSPILPSYQLAPRLANSSSRSPVSA